MSHRTGTKSRLTATALLRWTGISAMLAGVLFVGIQLLHPPDQLSAVDTDLWLVVASLTVAMSVFALIGITGIYASQISESGWPGLVGYALFSSFWLASVSFSFVEAFVLPQLTNAAPSFVEGFLGIFGGAPSEADLGMLPTMAPVAGGLYLLGGLLLGVATYRARVLPRLAGALLAVGAVVTITTAVTPTRWTGYWRCRWGWR